MRCFLLISIVALIAACDDAGYDSVFTLNANTLISEGLLHQFQREDLTVETSSTKSSCITVVGPFDAGKTYWTNKLFNSNLPSGNHFSTVGISERTREIDGSEYTVYDTQGTGLADSATEDETGKPLGNTFATDSIVLRTVIQTGCSILFVTKKFSTATRRQISFLIDTFNEVGTDSELRLFVLLNRVSKSAWKSTDSAIRSVLHTTRSIAYDHDLKDPLFAGWGVTPISATKKVKAFHLLAADGDHTELNTLQVLKALLRENQSKQMSPAARREKLLKAIQKSTHAVTSAREGQVLEEENVAPKVDGKHIVNQYTDENGYLMTLKGNDNDAGLNLEAVKKWMQSLGLWKSSETEVGKLILKRSYKWGTSNGTTKVDPSHISDWNFEYDAHVDQYMIKGMREGKAAPWWAILQVEAPGCDYPPSAHTRWESTLTEKATPSGKAISCDYKDGQPHYLDRGLGLLRTNMLPKDLNFLKGKHHNGIWYLLFESNRCKQLKGLCFPSDVLKQFDDFTSTPPTVVVSDLSETQSLVGSNPTN